MENITIKLNELVYSIIGFVWLIGIIGYGLKKNGLITVGKPKERRNCPSFCSEHPIVKDNQEHLKNSLLETDKKLDTISEDVSYIAGYIRGQRNERNSRI